jgi:hypothetical protein
MQWKYALTLDVPDQENWERHFDAFIAGLTAVQNKATEAACSVDIDFIPRVEAE